jgi:protein TonB
MQPEERRAIQEAREAEKRHVITTTARSSRDYNNTKASQKQQEEMIAQQAQMATAYQSDEISSLEARLMARKQAYAKRPRVRTVSTVSTRYDRDAAYVDAFRSRVEEVGNKNYPAKARERKISGNVRLMVSIYANGRVKEIVILKSSGHPILDEAARQSVRLAEPFQPFPSAIRQDTDILQIIRTWKFSDQLTSES